MPMNYQMSTNVVLDNMLPWDGTDLRQFDRDGCIPLVSRTNIRWFAWRAPFGNREEPRTGKPRF